MSATSDSTGYACIYDGLEKHYQQLTGVSCQVYLSLHFRARRHGPDRGTVASSIRQLSKEIGLSRGAVERAIATLLDMDFISVVTKGGNQWAQTVWRITKYKSADAMRGKNPRSHRGKAAVPLVGQQAPDAVPPMGQQVGQHCTPVGQHCTPVGQHCTPVGQQTSGLSIGTRETGDVGDVGDVGDGGAGETTHEPNMPATTSTTSERTTPPTEPKPKTTAPKSPVDLAAGAPEWVWKCLELLGDIPGFQGDATLAPMLLREAAIDETIDPVQVVNRFCGYCIDEKRRFKKWTAALRNQFDRARRHDWIRELVRKPKKPRDNGDDPKLQPPPPMTEEQRERWMAERDERFRRQKEAHEALEKDRKEHPERHGIEPFFGQYSRR